MLQRIAAHMDHSRFRSEILALTSLGIGNLGKEIADQGIPVAAAGMRKTPKGFLALHRLQKLLSRSKPDIVQTWMYHADVVGGLAAKVALGVPVVWGVHHANLDLKCNKLLTVATANLCAALSSSIPASIVCCSEASKRVHTRLGYQAKKIEVIPNGFDTSKFKPDTLARAAIREELGLAPSAFLIGMAARFHRDKDHETLIGAAALLAREFSAVHFALCGTGVDWRNEILASAVRKAELQDRIHLLGERKNTEQFFAGMDVVTSSSRAEAFPLSVGEAMSTGVPCVVTDVGDSAYLVGTSGIVVSRENPAALAAGWKRMITDGPEQRQMLGGAARRRIQAHFSLSTVIKQFENLYTRLTAKLCEAPGFVG